MRNLYNLIIVNIDQKLQGVHDILQVFEWLNEDL